MVDENGEIEPQGCGSAMCELWKMRGNWEQLCTECLRDLIAELQLELESRGNG